MTITTEQTNEMLKALKLTYRKHCCMCSNIGWEELDNIVSDTLYSVIGADEFLKLGDV